MPSIQQLKLLITLARVDGEVAEKERQFIINIGQANHLLVAEILPLFSSDHPLALPTDLSPEQRFEYIFTLVQLMKIDEKIYKDEIKYCARAASKLGYREEVLFDLMLKVKNVAMDENEMDALKRLTATYLLKG